MRESLFYPLVSGREGGSGLGLTLAQTFVTPAWRHHHLRQPTRQDDVHVLLLPRVNHSENVQL